MKVVTTQNRRSPNVETWLAQFEGRAQRSPLPQNKKQIYKHKFTLDDENELIKITERHGIDEPDFISNLNEFRNALQKTLQF